MHTASDIQTQTHTHSLLLTKSYLHGLSWKAQSGSAACGLENICDCCATWPRFFALFLWCAKQLHCHIKTKKSEGMIGASVSCWTLLRVEPDERPSLEWKALCSSGGDGEREGGKKSAPPWLWWRSVQKRNGGRVKQADCLERNKTRRLRGSGESLWELWLIPENWTGTHTQRVSHY